MTTQATDEILIRNNYDQAHLVGILQQLQAEFNYLPEEALQLVANRLGIPFSRVYAVATFYKTFSLTPRGRHQIQVCTGTACHVRGAPLLLRQLERDLDIQTGGTTPDLEFSLDSVRCLGCCSLAPVVRIDVDTFGKLMQRQASRLLKKYKKKEKE